MQLNRSFSTSTLLERIVHASLQSHTDNNYNVMNKYSNSVVKISGNNNEVDNGNIAEKKVKLHANSNTYESNDKSADLLPNQILNGSHVDEQVDAEMLPSDPNVA